MAERMTGFWGDNASWVLDKAQGPHEAGYLKLDASRARADLDWTPQLRLEAARRTFRQWYRGVSDRGRRACDFTLSQI